jgi:hypothetical protein
MNIFRRIDHFLSCYISLSDVGWMEKTDEFISTSDETMNDNEWSSYRDKENLAGEGALLAWIRLLADKEARKFHIFEKLLKLLNKEHSILEIGSGQCHIAVLLKSVGYEVIPTEQSGQDLLIDNISDLNTTVKILDILSMTRRNISNRKIGVILAVQVDYIFNDEEISILLDKANKSGVDVVFVNTQIIGPVQKIKYMLLKGKRLNDQNLKQHGYVRTLAMYKRLAKKNKMKVNITKGSKLLDSYYFIKFSHQTL